jgi:hypothetical protein
MRFSSGSHRGGSPKLSSIAGVVDNTYLAVAVSEDRNCKIWVNYHLSAGYPDRYVYGRLGTQ